jgi:putative endonuclease
MTHYVYVLAAQGGTGRVVTYVGWTLDLERRLAEHNGFGSRGAKSTRGRHWILLYAERHQSKGAAMAREYALKKDRKFRAQLRSP